MRRLLATAAALVALSVGLSACDVQLTPYAARVNGQAISQGSLTDFLNAIAADRPLRCALANPPSQTGSAGTQTPIEGVATGTFAATLTASELSELVQQQTVDAALTRLGLSISPLATTLSTDTLEQEFTPQSGSACTSLGNNALAELTSRYRAVIVSVQAAEYTIAAHLGGATLDQTGVAAYAKAHPVVTSLQCLSGIVVATQQKALALRAAIVRGASFATVARQNSTDSGSAAQGGKIGCVPIYELTPPLDTDVASLRVGAISAPISLSGSYALLEVTSRETEPIAEQAFQLVSSFSSAAGVYVNDLLAKAHVEIDPRFGSWQLVSGSWQVVPPQGPPTALVPNPASVTPVPPSHF